MKITKITWIITMIIMTGTLIFSLIGNFLFAAMALVFLKHQPLSFYTIAPFTSPIMTLILIIAFILFYKKNVFGFFLSILYGVLVLLAWFIIAIDLQYGNTLIETLFQNGMYFPYIAIPILIFTILSKNIFDFSKIKLVIKK